MFPTIRWFDLYTPFLEVCPEELATVTEAARMLGMSKPGVIRAIDRGVLSEVIDTECVYRGRRLLRDDVEEMVRAQASEKEEESKVGE